MIVRAAVADDLPRVYAIRHGVTDNRLADPSRLSGEEVGWYLHNAVFLVAEESGTMQGFVCANHLTGLLWALFVAQGRQSRGYGSALLQAATDRLRGYGHRQAFLMTGPDTKAAKFYAARGWHRTGTDMAGEAVFRLTLS